MERIIETIRKYDMIRPGMLVLAGVSGGADSVCLLTVLLEFQRECPFEIMAVHVEHGIRGQESLRDAEFVRELCERSGVACAIEHGDAPKEAKRLGLSVEEAARDLRYRIFEKIRQEAGADRIAVAHNEKDQAETVLWNLARGSALKGLGGIKPVRGRIIRPLLFTSREQIERILKERGIAWRTDETNLDVEYTRNRLRIEVLPYFERNLNRQAVRHIAEAAKQLREAQGFIEKQAKRAADGCIFDAADGVILKLEPFAREEEYLQGELLRECVSRCAGGAGLKDVGRVHIEMLRKLALLPCGRRQDLPGGVTASRRDGAILFRKEGSSGAKSAEEGCGRETEEILIRPGDCVRIGEMMVTARKISRRQYLEARQKDPAGQEPGAADENLLEKKYTKWLSCDTIKNSICCRRRKAGDYLVINARGGRKKLKDYMIDRKIPREERDSLRFFADGSHVLWIPGYRISEAARVTDDTREILEITLNVQSPCRD